MTHENIVYDRRRALLEHAARIGNVSEACRVFGVSRNSYYKRLASASEYGLSALLPKERRSPHQPNAMSPEEVSTILAEAVARPTLGAGALLTGATCGALARTRILLASAVGGAAGVFGFFFLVVRLFGNEMTGDNLRGSLVLAAGGGIVALVGSLAGWKTFGQRNAA